MIRLAISLLVLFVASSSFASGNSVQVLFRNSLKGDRDMYLVTSRDQGMLFGDAIRLGRTSWKLNACPMDGGMLAVNSRGELHTVWRRDKTIFSAGTEPGAETLLGAGEQPWTSASADGFFTVWTSKRDGNLQLLRPGAAQIEKISENSSFPVVVSPSHASSSAYVFWEKRGPEGYSIVGQKIQ